MKISETELPEDVGMILERLNNNGKGFIVGGALRDMILGTVPKDYDFATDLPYDTVKEIFSDFRNKEIGKAFGIIQITINNQNYEIARFRKEHNIKGRKELEINSVKEVEEDLGRRDFTFNSMAYNKERGIIDPFNGKEDIRKRVINFIGDSEKRIEEDPLRMLRAFRFMSRLGFELGKETERAIKKHSDLLFYVANERKGEEFNKILLGKNVKKTLEKMKECRILERLIQGIERTYEFDQCNPYHKDDLFSHIVNVVDKVKSDDLILKWAALLHDIGKPETQTFDRNGTAHYFSHEKIGGLISKKILSELHQTSEIKENVGLLVEKHMLLHKELRDSKWIKLIRELGPQNMERLINLSVADNESKKIETEKYNELRTKYDKMLLRAKPEITENTLAVSGNDIMKYGIKGKEIGMMKTKLLNMILEGVLENKKEELLKKVEKFISKKSTKKIEKNFHRK